MDIAEICDRNAKTLAGAGPALSPLGGVMSDAASEIRRLREALREIAAIGSTDVKDAHDLWLITGNMVGEAKRVLNGVPLASTGKN